MIAAALALLGFGVYLGGARASGFIRDDYYIVAGNALLSSWRLLPKLLSVGYWESALGAGAPVAEYRPALMLTYFLNLRLLGASPAGFHLVNAALHAGNVALVFLLLRRRLAPHAAAAAAALFAVLPVHVEAVAYVSGRSELLATLFLLLAWLDLENGAREARRGLLWYALALLSKEQAVLLPALLAADDWVRGGKAAFSRRRLSLYGALAASTVAYLGLRALVLSSPFHGGYDYFLGVGPLEKALTVAKFWCVHYLFPLATGLGLRSDYSRPFVPDSTAGDTAAWLCLAFWAALAASTARGLLRRRPAALLVCLFVLPLLPTSHLLVRLDTLGAERFLYLPSLAFCAAAGWALARLPRRAFAAAASVACLLYAARTVARAEVWLDEDRYYAAAVAENPVSAGARSGYGVRLARQGRLEEARASFLRALELNPAHPAAYFNLGKLAWDAGRVDEADAYLRQAEARGLVDSDTLVLRGLVAEKRGDLAGAVALFARAASVRPWDPLAHFNLARGLQTAGRPLDAAREYRHYLALSPGADDAPAIAALCRALESAPR